jgi:hypothetical protein
MDLKTYGKRSNSVNSLPLKPSSFECVDLSVGVENLEPVIQNRLPTKNSNAMNNQVKKRKKDEGAKQSRAK